ncbi:MAG: DUF5615 family PIN-like protein [Anaerolineae bacterium]|nr:DUF5615 family PIN-like protein [Anaerolineae bacterium]
MRFLADENFDNRILRGVSLKHVDFDVIRVQDTEVYQADDAAVLEWAAQEGRIILTRDVKTMPDYAYQRIDAGLPMPGMVEVSRKLSVGQAVEELLIFIGASDAAEWENRVTYLPLR